MDPPVDHNAAKRHGSGATQGAAILETRRRTGKTTNRKDKAPRNGRRMKNKTPDPITPIPPPIFRDVRLVVKQYPDGGTGNYMCHCSSCKNTFIGHKRDRTCPNCEIGSVEFECGLRPDGSAWISFQESKGRHSQFDWPGEPWALFWLQRQINRSAHEE